MLMENEFKRTILAIYLLLFTSSVVFGELAYKDYDGYMLFHIRCYNLNNSCSVLKNVILQNNINTDLIDVWNIKELPNTENLIHVLIHPIMKDYIVKLLQDNSIQYEIKIENIKEIIKQEKNGNNAKAGDLQDITFDKFYRHHEINTYLENLHLQYPNTTRIINLGKSHEGRDMKLIHISSDGFENTKKPAILIEGGIHAREWIAPSQVLYIISQLVDERKDLYQHLDWYLLPVLNPDGYEFTHDYDRLWRKTRSKVFGENTPSVCVGTDGNRNFNIGWIPFIVCSNIFGGVKPNSEVEVENFTNFATSIKDQIKLYLSFHSYGNKILYSYGYTYREPNNWQELSKLGKVVSNSMPEKFIVGSSFSTLYYVPGGSVDWFTDVLNVSLSYCLEITADSFILNETDILNVVSGVFKGVNTFAKYVEKKYCITEPST